MLYLTILRDGQRTQRVAVRWPRFTIGRAPDNHVPLDASDISRRHAEIEVRDHALFVRDLGSRNGVSVDGERITEALLKPGERFMIGGALLIIGEALSEDGLDPVSASPSSGSSRPDREQIRLSGGAADGAEEGTLQGGLLDRDGPLDRLSAVASALAERDGSMADRLLRAAMLYFTALSGAVFLVSRGELSFAATLGEEFDPPLEHAALASALESAVVQRVGATRLIPLVDAGRAIGVVAVGRTLRHWSTAADERAAIRVLARLLAQAAHTEMIRGELEQAGAGATPRVQQAGAPGIAADGPVAGMIAEDPLMRSVVAQIDLVAQSSSAVLVRGETGTGKELVARRVHLRSNRAQGPFIPVNCGSIPPTLLESTLFGIEKGVATGVGSSKGVFELAHGGTLFLDEIGELPLEMQTKFLRVLEERTVQPIGAKTPRPADVRIVAATNRDLRRMISDRTFREDLYYRLRVVEVLLPPLRQRRDDIVPLARHFLREFSRRDGKPIRGLTVGVADALRGYRWPGNVRELRNIVERAVVLCRDELLSEDVLPQELVSTQLSSAEIDRTVALLGSTWKEARATLERLYFANLVKECNGQVNEIAERSGIDRRNVYEKLNRYQLLKRRADARGMAD